MNSSTTGLRLAADAAIDLHLHTTYSDGHWTLEPLFDTLLRERFGLAAITDHDRPDTAAVIQRLAQEKGLPVLVAVEMSAAWKGELVDMLCYGFDPDQNALDALARDLRRRQQENTQEVCENLGRQGCIFPSEVVAAIQARPNLQQPFAIVDFLKAHGYGLGDPSAGRLVLEAGGAFATNTPAAIVEAAHHSGAVCLLAHPGRGDGFVKFDKQLLDEFRQEAPVDGLEVDYPLHTPDQAAMYREYARHHGLLTSAGSDSHGPEKPPIPRRAEASRDLLERLGIQVV